MNIEELSAEQLADLYGQLQSIGKPDPGLRIEAENQETNYRTEFATGKLYSY